MRVCMYTCECVHVFQLVYIKKHKNKQIEEILCRYYSDPFLKVLISVHLISIYLSIYQQRTVSQAYIFTEGNENSNTFGSWFVHNIQINR